MTLTARPPRSDPTGRPPGRLARCLAAARRLLAAILKWLAEPPSPHQPG